MKSNQAPRGFTQMDTLIVVAVTLILAASLPVGKLRWRDKQQGRQVSYRNKVERPSHPQNSRHNFCRAWSITNADA
jgi:hypothetical protein